MQGGFSFCGTDISDLGLEYVPEIANTYVFAGSSHKLHEQAFDGHTGGYYFGSTQGVKIFTLRCIFQDAHINQGILTDIENFFQIGRSGRLVFAKRPWIYYVATVTGVDMTGITNYLNGFITIQLKSYYPFGRCDDLFYDKSSSHAGNIAANSNMLPSSVALSTSPTSNGTVLTTKTIVPLYNGGTRNAAVAIELAGDVGAGITISNETTGQSCGFVSLTKKQTTNANKYLVSDGIAGRNVLTNGTSVEDASLYHDYGYIDLLPNQVLFSDIELMVMADGTVRCTNNTPELTNDIIGAYIFADGSWRKITAWSNSLHSAFVTSTPMQQTGTVRAYIATMNEIAISPVSTMSITRANFVYKPTFA